MFRRILNHPQGEFLSLAENYVLSLMLLHWSQSMIYIYHMCGLQRYLQLLEYLTLCYVIKSYLKC